MSESKKPLLAEEVDFYNQNKKEFLDKYTNRYLLIKENKLIGDFSTQNEAAGEGVRRFGAGPFLVRLSGEDTAVESVPALTWGLL